MGDEQRPGIDSTCTSDLPAGGAVGHSSCTHTWDRVERGDGKSSHSSNNPPGAMLAEHIIQMSAFL